MNTDNKQEKLLPLISVIVPVYNVEKYLCRCIDSVISQTYKNLEIILVDDGSPDNCPKICDDYATKDARIKVIHQKNGGLSAARNAGIEIAKGDFLSFIDSDDWVAPQFIDVLVQTAQKQNVLISQVGYFFVEPNRTKKISTSHNKQKYQVISSHQAICMGVELYFFAWNKLYSRSLFKEIRFPVGCLFEDTGTIYKVFLQTDKVAICNEPLYYYNRLNMNSIIRSNFSIKKLDLLKFTSEILNYAIEQGDKKLIYLIKQKRAYAISGLFRQMAAANFNDLKIIIPMQKELRRNIFKLILSKQKITNKLFAIVCCINFNLAAKIYRKIFLKDMHV